MQRRQKKVQYITKSTWRSGRRKKVSQAVVFLSQKSESGGEFQQVAGLYVELSQDFHCSKDTIQQALRNYAMVNASMPNPKVAAMFLE